MKRSFSILLFSLCIYISAKAQEINWFKGTWLETKAKAKAENKYIFIDGYTVWCGACKLMDQETFSDSDVISFINKNYVAIQLDMEAGEGQKIAMKYEVDGFPTFLIFNPNGKYVFRAEGDQKKDLFLTTLNKTLNKEKQFNAPGYSASIDLAYPDFYKDAHDGSGNRKYPKTEEVTAYLDKQTDLFSEINWAIISSFYAGEKYTQFFLDNIDKYKNLYGDINQKLTILIYSKLQQAIAENSEAKLNDILALTDKYVTENKDWMKIYYKIGFYTGVKDWNNEALAIDEMVEKEGYENTIYINML